MNLTIDDPWVTTPQATCEHCHRPALRDSTEHVPAGVQFLCSRCVRRGIPPDDGRPPLALAALSAADAEAIGRALLEAAEHAKKQKGAAR